MWWPRVVIIGHIRDRVASSLLCPIQLYLGVWTDVVLFGMCEVAGARVGARVGNVVPFRGDGVLVCEVVVDLVGTGGLCCGHYYVLVDRHASALH